MHKAVRAATRKLINKTKSCAHIVIFAQNNCADAIAILAPKMLQINIISLHTRVPSIFLRSALCFCTFFNIASLHHSAGSLAAQVSVVLCVIPQIKKWQANEYTLAVL
jgi:hypothetical protein